MLRRLMRTFTIQVRRGVPPAVVRGATRGPSPVEPWKKHGRLAP